MSRTERNDHLETHFVHRNCENCSRQVIVIGDLEFELHQPTHCKPNESIDDEKAELVDIYETNDNHSSDDESLQQLQNPENHSPRPIEPESDKYDEAMAASETEVKLPKPNIKRKAARPTTRRTAKRKSIINVKNGNQSSKKSAEHPNDKRAANTDSDDDVIKEMDVAMRKRRRKYKKLPKTVPCTKCDSMFGTERTLKIHMNQVHGIKERYICPICSREFKISGNLKQHIETHSDYKRYVCDWCGKGFHLPYNLKEHMNTHTGARPYKCETCGKTFGRNTLRQAHMRIHTGEKPYQCSEENCDRAYAYQTDLKRHRRSVHGIITKTFPCPICSKIFYENKFLTKHLNVHQGNA